MRNAFKARSQNSAVPRKLGQMIELLNEQVVGGKLVTPSMTKSVLSLESLSDDARYSLMSAGDTLTATMETIVANLDIEGSTDAQYQAAAYAGVLSGDIRSFVAHKSEQIVATESMSVVTAAGITDAIDGRSFGMEAYDERENRNATVYSIAYNYQASRQDEFGETLFPTITLSPDNVGFGVTVNLMMVFDGIERKISGNFSDFNMKNIIRAVADPTVLKKEQTRVIPVYRPQSADKFVADIPAYNMLLEGESIPTAPLAFSKKVDLLGLSVTDALLTTGVMDMTDSLDPSINLLNIYAKVGRDILKIPVNNLPTSNFVFSAQGNYRLGVMNFSTQSVLVNQLTKNADGSDLITLAPVAAGNLAVRLELRANGDVNIQTGELNVFGNYLTVHSVTDSNGNLLDLTSTPAAELVAAFGDAKLLGYDIYALRTNMNRRQRGQFIDVQKYTQMYNVPLLSPITTIHPINTDGQVDASDVQALITATRIRTSNDAVTALLNINDTLSQYVDSRDSTGVGPDVLGVGRFFVRPTYEAATLDMNDAVQSVKSHERAADMQAAMVNKIRDMAYRMYRDSEYKAAADALAGGVGPLPVVVLATDPVLSRYLTVSGDLRTLGNEFDVRIVHTLDIRMRGKIAVSFGVFDETRNSVPNPLNFGNLVWAPELVLTANISRGNTISKETVVQPRYRFTSHCPILGMLTVVNVPDVVASKVIYLTKAV